MDKYSEHLEKLSFNLLHIAQPFANNNKPLVIDTTPVLRTLLHKSERLICFIEETLDKDYYYFVDWGEMRQQCKKSTYGMKET